jgi:hypothetical protein
MSLATRLAWTTTPLAALFAALTGCAHGPRLAASWYVTYCAAGDGPPTVANAPCRDGTAADGVDDIHILIVNTGAPGTLGRVRLARGKRGARGTDALAGETALTGPAWSKRLDKGGFVVLPMGAFPAGATNLRRCLIPVELLVIWESRIREHPVKVSGLIPTALPLDWIRQCAAAPAAASTLMR